MKATLLPLSGKYYGTKILIEDKGLEAEVVIWDQYNDRSASPRELERYGCTAEEYEYSDSHYEATCDLEFARKIVDAINKAGEEERQ